MIPDEDRELLAELGALLRRCEPVPAAVLAAAEGAFALVRLPTDWTWLEPLAEPAPVRSAARTFRFADGEVSLLVEVRRGHLAGLVSPAAEVELRWPGGSARRVRPDPAGFFLLSDPPRGPLRLVVGGTRATPWFLP